MTTVQQLKKYYNTTLDLVQQPDGNFIDQYGRVLQPYTNEKGEPDLRPIGIGWRR